mgnify:CR=1 FL=1
MHFVLFKSGEVPWNRRIAGLRQFSGPRGPGLIPPQIGGILRNGNPGAPTKNAVIWVFEARLCANCALFLHLVREKLVISDLFSLGTGSLLSRNQEVPGSNCRSQIVRSCLHQVEGRTFFCSLSQGRDWLGVWYLASADSPPEHV